MPIRNKEDAQRVLRHVSDEKRFYCHDGKILNNLYELKNALEKMSHACYIHHVRDVLGDEKLANDLVKAPAQKEAALIIKDRIAWLQDRA
jgi:glycogen debranching enzyme